MNGSQSLIVIQPAATHVAVSVNGIPLHERTMPPSEGESTTTPVDHWLRPGENVLSLRAYDCRPGATTITRVYSAAGRSYLAEIVWPRDFAALDGAEPTRVLSKSFTMPETHLTPAYATAPRVSVPPEGTPETWAPIEALHGAFAEGRPDGVFDGLSFQSAERHRYHPTRSAGVDVLRAHANERVTAPYKMVPLDREQTRFESCADGKLVRVRRIDGVPLIAGEPTTPDTPGYQLSRVFLILSEGRYRILH